MVRARHEERAGSKGGNEGGCSEQAGRRAKSANIHGYAIDLHALHPVGTLGVSGGACAPRRRTDQWQRLHSGP